MRLTVALCFLFVASALAAKLQWHELDLSYSFDAYLRDFGKRYEGAEYKKRESIYNANLKKIVTHNQDSSKTWKENVNHLADWTPEEMKSLYGYDKKLGYARKAAMKETAKPIESTPPQALPEWVDWRTKGVVSPVKDQGDCGSCWSFATAETVESYWALATGDLWILSEQQILDCTVNPNDCGGTGGCSGGTVEVALATIIKLGGLSSEWTYPYLSHNGKNFGTCNFTTNGPAAAQVSSYVNLPSNQYTPLLNAVATLGPIAISVDASSWSFYDSGVFNGCNQTSPDLDHAVQLVGYGTENGSDYWLVRNSWTPTWGESGYIKLFRSSNVTCGIDPTPGDGDGCNGGPSQVTVCGTCGILYDSVYPVIPPQNQTKF